MTGQGHSGFSPRTKFLSTNITLVLEGGKNIKYWYPKSDKFGIVGLIHSEDRSFPHLKISVVFILCILSAETVTYYRTLFIGLKNQLYIINLLSGNSPDLIDSLHLQFSTGGQIMYQSISSVTIPSGNKYLPKGKDLTEQGI